MFLWRQRPSLHPLRKLTLKYLLLKHKAWGQNLKQNLFQIRMSVITKRVKKVTAWSMNDVSTVDLSSQNVAKRTLLRVNLMDFWEACSYTHSKNWFKVVMFSSSIYKNLAFGRNIQTGALYKRSVTSCKLAAIFSSWVHQPCNRIIMLS